MRFGLNRSDARRPWHRHVAWAVLVGLVGALAFVPSAQAAGPYVLEVAEALDGTGFGEVACEYKEEGLTEVEQPCEELEFAGKKLVKLIPVPELGSEFVHFENATGSASTCNGKTGACSFTLEADSYVEARFDEIEPTLTVHVTGEGEVPCVVEGLLQSCEEEEEFEFDTAITLEPEPAEGWEFAGFGGGTGSASVCSGQTKPCSFILEKDSTIEVLFVSAMPLMTVSKAGTGQGTVTSSPAGIDCGATCSAKFVEGAEVALTASPASGSTFSGWTGACSGATTCKVTMSEARSVTAAFTQESSAPPPSPPTPPSAVGEGKAAVGAIAKVRAGKARVSLTCSGGPCTGTLKLTARLKQGAKRRTVTIGKTSFSLAPGASETVKVRLSYVAARQLKTAGSLKAKASGDGVTPGIVKLKS